MISSHLRRTGVQLGRALLEQRRFIRRPALNTSQLTEGRRTGALAMKVGMIPVWDTWGTRHATTVLQLDNCEVVQVKTEETDGYTALQLGVGVAKPSRVKRSTAGHVGKAGVEPKRKLGEFRVSADALLPAGTLINALHFVPGQLVDVCGTSKGKGFQGVMKLWNFKGGKATHGNSLSHRVMGSTGNCQDPGRVFKGKKMPGRMGGDRITVQNLFVLKVDPQRQLLYVKGAVPGTNGNYVRIVDSVKGPFYPSPPPFPTFLAAEMAEAVAGKAGEEKLPEQIFAPAPTNDVGM
eukprot:CAMPEP_0173355134 /NCGR_PEP_ID=MMETSP1144-20121109/17584_1 /TAXON_ID=483371 /ORGANISM="non described non described, Strain CCMP2298" /LENGTH=292 /DNA_ID=CAMNT_0014303785 /DNA_START=279 /DNA_END=1154 /DNA_ORIENTATION=+